MKGSSGKVEDRREGLWDEKGRVGKGIQTPRGKNLEQGYTVASLRGQQTMPPWHNAKIFLPLLHRLNNATFSVDSRYNCQILRQNCTKLKFGWRRTYSWIWGPTCKRKVGVKGWYGRNRKGMGEEEGDHPLLKFWIGHCGYTSVNSILVTPLVKWCYKRKYNSLSLIIANVVETFLLYPPFEADAASVAVVGYSIWLMLMTLCFSIIIMSPITHIQCLPADLFSLTFFLRLLGLSWRDSSQHVSKTRPRHAPFSLWSWPRDWPPPSLMDSRAGLREVSAKSGRSACSICWLCPLELAFCVALRSCHAGLAA